MSNELRKSLEEILDLLTEGGKLQFAGELDKKIQQALLIKSGGPGGTDHE